MMASNGVKAIELPVLDVTNTDADTAKQLIDAVSTHGFVYLKNNHDEIPPTEVDEMFDLSRRFFASPNEVKATCAVGSGKSGKNSGWFGMNTEMLDPEKQKRGDFKECFNMNEFLNGKAQQPLPPPLLENEDQLNQFQKHCLRLCQRVLELFAIGLQIDSAAGGKSFFLPFHDPAYGPSGSVFRLLYYPTLPVSEEYDEGVDIRAGAHSDYGTVTLLFQRPGQPGLEILTSKRGDPEEKWYPVPVNPTNEPHVPILLNVGDLLSFWTGGLLRSTVHRVIFPKDGKGEDRYSIAYFCHAVDSSKLEPIPSEIVKSHAEKVNASESVHAEPLTAKQHLESRLAATYTSSMKKE